MFEGTGQRINGTVFNVKVTTTTATTTRQQDGEVCSMRVARSSFLHPDSDVRSENGACRAVCVLVS